jgi:PAS domain S-box-containing protein
MDTSIILGLLQNTAILLAFSLIYDYLWSRYDNPKSLSVKVVAGFILGAFGVILMMTPWKMVPGIVFDVRSVLLSVSGLFFGFVPTVIAMIITVLYRIMLGGSGMAMGVAVILVSGATGLIWSTLRPGWRIKNTVMELLSLGITVHLLMLLSTLLLPREIWFDTLKMLVLPVLLIYPPATLFLGLLMIHWSINWQNRKDVNASEKRFRTIIEQATDAMYLADFKGNILDVNSQSCKMLGYTRTELLNMNLADIDLVLAEPDKIDEYLQKIVHGETFLFESVQRHKNGSTMPVEISSGIIELNGIPIVIGFARNLTERKRIELILKQSEEHFRSIFENNQTAILITDTDAVIKMVNNAFCDVVGVQKEEIIGSTWLDWIPSPDKERLLDYNRKRLSEDEEAPEKFEFSFYHKNGSIRYGLANGSVMEDSDEIIVSFTDITERRILEQVQSFLLECGSPATGGKFFEPLAIYLSQVLNMEYVCIDRLAGDYLSAETLAVCNEGVFEKNVSYTLKDTPCGSVVGNKVCCFPEKVSELFPHDEALQVLNAESYIGVTLWASDGKPIGLIAVIGHKPLENSKLAESILNLVAIRAAGELERAEAEEALRRNEALLAQSQQIAHIGSWDLDLATRRLYWSDEVFRIFGLKPQQFQASYDYFLSRVHPDDRKIVDITYLDSLRDGKYGYETEHRIIRENTGEIRYMHEKCVHQRDDSGRVYRSVGMVQDMTESKLYEIEIHKLNEELEQRVIDRTAQLEAANKELEAFSYSVSHDLRTPLRALNGFSNILIEEYAAVLDDEGKRMLTVISQNATKMGHLIDDLLSFARLGRIEIVPSPINMKTLAAAVYNELVPETDKDKIRFTLGNIPATPGDPSMIKQVWVNLIGNAIKFTSKKTDRHIEIGVIAGENENIYFVRDNGAGFEMAHATKLFGVFQRLHSLKEFDGIGAGLAIVRRIILRHNGRIWAEGKVDEGATFYFSIPIIK